MVAICMYNVCQRIIQQQGYARSGAAIQEANAFSGAKVIKLIAGTYRF
jgi:hypothetical protein